MKALDRVIMRHLLKKVADEQPIVIGGDETNGKKALQLDRESERCYNTDRLVWRTIKGNKVLVKSETGQIMSGPDELNGAFVGKKKKPYNLQKKAKVGEPESINIPNDEYKKLSHKL